MDKRNLRIQQFQWILNELVDIEWTEKEKGQNRKNNYILSNHWAVFNIGFPLFAQEMGDSIIANNCKDPRKRVVEMLHALQNQSKRLFY